MGVSWPSLSVRLISGGRIRWSRGCGVDPTWGPGNRMVDNDLIFVWAGQGWMRTRQGRAILGPGTCLWLRPGWLYQAGQNPDDPLGMTFIHFDLLDARGRVLPPGSPSADEVFHPSDAQLVDTITRRVVELRWYDYLRRTPTDVGSPRPFHSPPGAANQIQYTTPGDTAADPTSPLLAAAAGLLKGLLMDLDATTRPPERPGAAWGAHHRMVTRLAMRIEENPAEVPSIAAMADEAGYSADHFARLFKTVTGLGPQAFVMKTRVAKACGLFAHSDLSVKEIARSLGYGSPYFFSRQFKEQTGQTPTGYREARRRGD